MVLCAIMPVRSRAAAGLLASTILLNALWLASSSSGHAQGAGAFDRLAGQWEGLGSVELSNATREPIKCRAAYDVLTERNNLQLNIRCSGDSYNFNILGSATLTSGIITGTWSETTTGASGTITGKAGGDHVQVLAQSPAFSANLTLVTHGDRQSVDIKSQDPQSNLKGATINLRRS
jgi:hypothetical protein